MRSDGTNAPKIAEKINIDTERDRETERESTQNAHRDELMEIRLELRKIREDLRDIASEIDDICEDLLKITKNWESDEH